MQPLLEIKQGRAGYLLAAMAAAFFGFVFFDIGINHAALSSRYLNGLKPIDEESGMQFLPYAVLIVTIPLTIFFTYRAIKNPAVFVLYRDGLEANTNGISTGFVPWNSITEMEEVSMTLRRFSGIRMEAVLAIYVDEQYAPSNWFFSLTSMLSKVSKQSGGLNPNQSIMNKPSQGFPIFIPKSVFGDRYDEVLQSIQQFSKQKVISQDAV
jgi:hypothetical protein